MDIQGLDYNTTREKLKLMAYGREIQQMVDMCVELPTKEERQACAQTIIATMKNVVQSNLSNKERTPVLWYHLALMSDFKLDIDYPVEIVHQDKLATPPAKIPYEKTNNRMRHYGKLTYQLLERLKGMEPGDQRNELALETAYQMLRTQQSWGTLGYDPEKVVSDLARYTDGIIQLSPNALSINTIKKKKKKK